MSYAVWVEDESSRVMKAFKEAGVVRKRRWNGSEAAIWIDICSGEQRVSLFTTGDSGEGILSGGVRVPECVDGIREKVIA